MTIAEVNNDTARAFLDAYHPLRCGGCLRGAKHRIMGYEQGWPVFIALFVYPRSRWSTRDVVLELSRLAWSPLAKRSAATFLRKCLRYLSRSYDGEIVTYAMPGTTGVLYERSGFKQDGHSGGAAWSKRGEGERPTPDTIGTGRKLKRYFTEL